LDFSPIAKLHERLPSFSDRYDRGYLLRFRDDSGFSWNRVTGFANVTLKDHSTVEAIALQSHAGKPGTQKNSGERTLRHRTTGGNR
jgi:hypothetical protein